MTAATPAPSGRKGRQAVLWTAKILVSTALLYILLARVDTSRLWALARNASPIWLAFALLLYLGMVVISAWRWNLLLRAQHVAAAFGRLVNSFLVAVFFNNFLPSNIGGDVVRIRDTARVAGSKTLAATVVLVDRGIGLLGLVFVAALGATLAARNSEAIGPLGPGVLWMMLGGAVAVAAPAVLMPQRIGQLLSPLRRLHQEWVETRIERLTGALGKFRDAPSALIGCFAGAILVQAVLVGFYAAIAHGLHIRVPLAHLAIVVPISFVVQMLPLSVNGWGVRESTFGFYFTRLGLPLESALALSFIGAALTMLFSISGAFAYLSRRREAEQSGPAGRADTRT
ncbi:MAG TPA: lysylphosphatidylglycerol synthase transmembrane domain-containing protein [Vicinamibacterales bacterium]|nr:lysylphosphatidylglycerol synthase transmembrane domain-containing protein [Vicinamibacterales bacterium]